MVCLNLCFEVEQLQVIKGQVVVVERKRRLLEMRELRHGEATRRSSNIIDDRTT